MGHVSILLVSRKFHYPLIKFLGNGQVILLVKWMKVKISRSILMLCVKKITVPISSNMISPHPYQKVKSVFNLTIILALMYAK